MSGRRLQRRPFFCQKARSGPVMAACCRARRPSLSSRLKMEYLTFPSGSTMTVLPPWTSNRLPDRSTVQDLRHLSHEIEQHPAIRSCPPGDPD